MSELRPKTDQITEDSIRTLVDRFYVKIRADPELGPIFAAAVPGDWAPHLTTMRDFWSSVMLTTGRYKGNPMAVHLRIEGIAPPLFDRWLALFGQTCGELFDVDTAEAFSTKGRANRGEPQALPILPAQTGSGEITSGRLD